MLSIVSSPVMYNHHEQEPGFTRKRKMNFEGVNNQKEVRLIRHSESSFFKGASFST